MRHRRTEARKIQRALAQAGLRPALFTPWGCIDAKGHPCDGFLVIDPHDGYLYVFTTYAECLGGNAAQIRAAVVLREHGYRVRGPLKPRNGHVSSIRVWTAGL